MMNQPMAAQRSEPVKTKLPHLDLLHKKFESIINSFSIVTSETQLIREKMFGQSIDDSPSTQSNKVDLAIASSGYIAIVESMLNIIDEIVRVQASELNNLRIELE